jgi:secreted trypsin-like serine protease
VPSPQNRYPYQAGLYSRVKKLGDTRKGPSCGASVLTENYLITAAHCFQKGFVNVSNYYVLLGDHNFADKTDGQEQFEIEEIVRHPEYLFTDDGVEVNDLAIIKLARPAIFSPRIGHVCLPDQQGLRNLGYVR